MTVLYKDVLDHVPKYVWTISFLFRRRVLPLEEPCDLSPFLIPRQQNPERKSNFHKKAFLSCLNIKHFGGLRL